MGLVFTSLWNRLFKFKDYKICIIGLDSAGKSTILYRLSLGETIATNPTIGSNVEEIKHNGLSLQCWDLGGQDSLRATWSTYFTNTNAIIMVVDSADRKRIHLVKEEFQRVLQSEQIKDAIVLVFANKQDLPNKMEPADIATQLQLTSIKSHTWQIQGCCALTGEGLYEGMDWITTQFENQK